MFSFATPAWESNDSGDKRHKEFFEGKKILKGKISKSGKVKKNNKVHKPISNDNLKNRPKFQMNKGERKQVGPTFSKKVHKKPNEIRSDANVLKENPKNKTKFNKKKVEQSVIKQTFSKKIHKKPKDLQTVVNSDNPTNGAKFQKTKQDKFTNKIHKKRKEIQADVNVESSIKKAQPAKSKKKPKTNDQQSENQIVKKPDRETPLKSIQKKNRRPESSGSKKTDIYNLGVSRKNQLKMSLKQRMMEKLKSSRFRYLNEQIYTTDGKSANDLFKNDRDAFLAYHDGYKQQASKWPVNPIDVIIKSVKKMPVDKIIADMGCGDAKLAESVPQKVHSFDLVAVNDRITECEMSNVPLEKNSVDVVVFSLSLMGTNIQDFIYEANRILKDGGILKIAEVESRFDKVETFIKGVEQYGFKHTWKDLAQKLFYFIDFKKLGMCKKKNKLPTISLLPCIYKKR